MASADRPGWYDDPDDSEQLRYFDGILWTDHVTPRTTTWSSPPATDPPAEPTPSPSTAISSPATPSTPPPPPTNPYDAPASWPPAGGLASAGPPAPTPLGPTTSDGWPLAAIWQRAVAFILDGLITTLVSLVLGGYFAWRAASPMLPAIEQVIATGELAALGTVRYDTAWLVAYLTTSLVVGVVYHWRFLARFSATPGKMALGLSVRLAESPGIVPSPDALRRSVVRPILSLLSNVPTVGLLATALGVADLVSALWHPQRQTLHDRVGRTVVVIGAQPPRPTSGPVMPGQEPPPGSEPGR